MFKNPWFTLVLGLLVGVVVGYLLAEEAQKVGPARVAQPAPGAAGLPAGHPPLDTAAPAPSGQEAMARQVAVLEEQIKERPGDPGPMISLANLRFDAGHWQAARLWYERALELDATNPDVLIDLAVVYRNLSDPEKAIELIERALAIRPDHPVGWFNKVVILHHDLERTDEARAALAQLKEIGAVRPGLDVSALEAELAGS